ncbi:MAG: DUF4118 domain-containing protein [Thermoanaerobaculia bacterium]
MPVPGPRHPRAAFRPADYALATAVVAVAVLLCFGLRRFLPVASLALVFVCAVLVVALRSRKSVAGYTALLSSLAYNYFFTEPRFTLHIHSAPDLVAVATFLLAALTVGHLATRQREQFVVVEEANHRIRALQVLGQRLAAAVDEEGVFRAATAVLDRSLGVRSVVLTFADAGGEPLRFSVDPAPSLTAGDLAAAREAVRAERATGRFEGDPETDWWFLPLGVEGDRMGAVALQHPAGVERLAEPERELARAVVAQTAQAASRVRLASRLEAVRVEGETERLRTALLSSVSHDLRSPLASVIGAASSLAAYGEAMPPSDRRELIDAIRTESERLDRYIQNLLDMTRLGSGPLRLDRDWVGLDEIVASAVARLVRMAPEARIDVDLEDRIPALYVHAALIEQALFNVLENAARFSPPGEPIRLRARREGEPLIVEVCDRGPGIAPAERERVFDLFHSGVRPEGTLLAHSAARGSGLGLTIVRGMIRAHGGSVEADAGEGGIGTVIRITLPLVEPPTAPAEEEEE